MRYLISLTVFIVALISFIPVSAQSDSCYAKLDFWHDYNTNTLHFINPNTGEFVAIAGENVMNFYRHDSSPDCHYIAATLIRRDANTPVDCYGQYSVGRSGDLTIWDAETGQVVAEYSDIHYSRSEISWNPYGSQITLTTCEGAILWDYRDNRRMKLTDTLPHGAGFDVTWDNNPSEVFGLIIGYNVGMFSEENVYSFNWRTFRPVFTFHNHIGNEELCNFHGYDVTDTYVLVYCASGSAYKQAAISIWNRTSHELLYQVNGRSAGPIGLRLSQERIDISPDGRYLAIAYGTLRIWDLWNLPENFEDRSATYQYSLAGYDKPVQNLVFIDNTIVEMTLDNNNLLRMNVETGEKLG